MNGYVYSVMAAALEDHPDDAKRHIARRAWDNYLRAYVPHTLCDIVGHRPIDAMWQPLIRRVGSQYAMWPVPTCERCLVKYRAMVGQVAVVASE